MRVREIPMSVQIYPECILKILVLKKHSKIQTLVVRIIARKEFRVNGFSVELIDRKREFSYLNFNKNNLSISFPPSIAINKFVDAEIPFEEFKKTLESHEKPIQTFRFVIENDSGKKFKTHELAFNKNWIIYKPDTGRYN